MIAVSLEEMEIILANAKKNLLDARNRDWVCQEWSYLVNPNIVDIPRENEHLSCLWTTGISKKRLGGIP